MLYMHSENFILPFSHDEVVHGKASLIDKMPGDVWQKHATLRTLYGFMFGHPGKKLLFMGARVRPVARVESRREPRLAPARPAQRATGAAHRFVRDLNRTYQQQPAFFEVDFDPAGFQWIDCNDNENSVFSLVRRARDASDFLVFVFNFTPVPRDRYRIGVPEAGDYAEILNSDSSTYGGTNVGNAGHVTSEAVAAHGFDQSLSLTIPPLGCLYLKKRG